MGAVTHKYEVMVTKENLRKIPAPLPLHSLWKSNKNIVGDWIIVDWILFGMVCYGLD
jgi:hypothetical protein